MSPTFVFSSMAYFWHQGQYLGAKQPANSCKPVAHPPGVQWAQPYKALKTAKIYKI